MVITKTLSRDPVCIGFKAGFPRRLEKLENESGHGKVMEHEKLAKSHGIFVISHGILPMLLLSYTKFVSFWVTAKKLSSDQESLHFPMFSAKRYVSNSKLEREMVMENQEMVMEKSWTNILTSLWEPCKVYNVALRAFHSLDSLLILVQLVLCVVPVRQIILLELFII